MQELLGLFLGTVLLRPYVFVFLAVGLVAATRDLGGRRALAFTAWAWAVAFIAEYSSTRTGIPFGLYHYTEVSREQELYLANVPFMDSLSFSFLAYAAFSLARFLLNRDRGFGVIALSGFLMMWLDLVIDPLAARGDRWFLGEVFYYPEGGVYFGVPLSNFLGWALVGWVIVGGYLAMSGQWTNGWPGLGVGLYYGILGFNLAITWWIGEPLLFGVGIVLHALMFGLLWFPKSVKAFRAGARGVYPASSFGFRSTSPVGKGGA